jgi:uncharacterized membrane protein
MTWTPRPDHPKLASDVTRGYVILGAVIPVTLLAQVALRAADVADHALIPATIFIGWASLGLLTGILTLAVFWRADGATLRRWLEQTTPRDRGAKVWSVLNGGGSASWAITGSVIAVAAVVGMAFLPELRAEPVVVASGIAVVVGSLFMTMSSYALRYARETATVGGFRFAGPTEPRFEDFFYLAVQVATTFGPSDVVVETTHARRLVTLNSIISFGFNTVIVALLVSVLVGFAG